jgi:polyisoprenoid-binding protein YceI
MKNFLKFTFLMFALSMFVACGSKGKDAKVSDTAGTVAKTEGTKYAVNAVVSKVMWTGSKPAGSHSGTIDVTAGEISAIGDMVTGGNFTFDMNTINVTDLEGDEKTYLENHLKGSEDKNKNDFFNVAEFPTAKFEITKVTKKEGDPTGNALVYGNLTMKGQTKQVAFTAMTDVKDGMVRVSTPDFKINRTDWGIKYGSPTFFEGLNDKAISDDISLKISLVAK